MKIARPKGLLERSAPSDLWRNTLSQIQSSFGRLVYLSSLRGANTGLYEHQGLAMLFGEDEANRALRRSHEECFAAWLNSTLEQQKHDLDLYLSTLPGNRKSIIATWLRLTPYRNLVPTSARPPGRQLFFCDFETLLHVLKAEYDVAVQDQDA